jgi:signal transduction histidine kinase
MLSSLRSRLIASYLLVVILAMAAAAGLAWTILDRAFLDVLRQNLLAQARSVAQTVEVALQASGAQPGAESGSELAAEPYSQLSNVLPGYHTRVIDEKGIVVIEPPELALLETPEVSGDSGRIYLDSPSTPVLSLAERAELDRNLGIPPSSEEESASLAYSLLNRPEIQSAFLGIPASEVRSYEWAPSRRILYAASPIYSPAGNVTSIAYVASPLPRFSLALMPDYFAPQLLGGVALAVLLAGGAGLLLARSLTRPLRKLKDAASALARGERTPPIPPASTEELASLSAAFNSMSTNLTTAQGELAALAQQREAILHGLADAVLAADADGEVILANPAAESLLDAAAEPLRDALQQTLRFGDPFATEITAQDRVIELLTTSLRDDQGAIAGAVAVGHDVTAYRQLDRLRTSFVSDVSHELRTPLTAIRGFVETLQEGCADDPDTRRRFLGTLASETDRLIRLTNDLLLLTRADAGQLGLQLCTTDLGDSVGRAAAQLEGSAREKRIATVVEASGGPFLVHGDADRIHQVLVNLLDNAIKFTPPDGRVSISVRSRGEKVSCTVADSGPGIPAQEMPLIFGRFYRGDPSRARRSGSGAGLGLAIARAIVEAHGGRLWAESEPGAGASFTFTLPVAR